MEGFRGVQEEHTDHTKLSLEVSPNLVLLIIRKVDVHDLGNYWKATSSQSGLKTFRFVTIFGNTIFLKARVSVSQIKPTHFPKTWKRKVFVLEKYQSLGFPIETN